MFTVSFSVSAQTISKLNVQGFHANFTPDGKNIIFTSSNYEGLKKLNVNTSTVEVLNREAGAGYNPIVGDDRVFFKTNKNKQEVLELDYKTQSLKKYSSTNSAIVFFENSNLKKNNSNLPIQAKSSSDLSSVELIYADGLSNLINIEKYKNKVWVSLSPDRTKILYTVVGQKTFITDLEGNTIASLDRTESPKWANDNTIVYMLTSENLDYITDGDIYSYSLNTKKITSLTSKFSDVALYPAMSVDEGKVVFNNDQGELFLINLTK